MSSISPPANIQNIAIIGLGKVGTALAKLIHDRAEQQLFIASRDIQKAQASKLLVGTNAQVCSIEEACQNADLVLLTVSDDVIGQVATKIAPYCQQGSIIAHCSGALTSDVIEHKQGFVASLHPLQTFPSVQAALEQLANSYCFFESSLEVKEQLLELINALGLKAVPIKPEAKVLYHAAAVFACNYLSSLMDAALELGDAADIDRQVLWQGLYPLINATLQNINQSSPSKALTGPIARGDEKTIEKHLQAISQLGDKQANLAELYTALGKQTIKLAQIKSPGIDTNKAEKLQQILEQKC